MACHNILPISFSLLRETEVRNFSKDTVAFFISDSSSFKIFNREIHALEFI